MKSFKEILGVLLVGLFFLALFIALATISISIVFWLIYGTIVYVLPAVIVISIVFYTIYAMFLIFLSLPFMPIVFLIGLMVRERSVTFARTRDFLVVAGSYFLISDTFNFSLTSALRLYGLEQIDPTQSFLPGLISLSCIVIYSHYARLIYLDGLKVALPLNFKQSYWERLKWPPAVLIALVFDFLVPTTLIWSYVLNHWNDTQVALERIIEQLHKSWEILALFAQYLKAWLVGWAFNLPIIATKYWLLLLDASKSVLSYAQSILRWWYADFL